MQAGDNNECPSNPVSGVYHPSLIAVSMVANVALEDAAVSLLLAAKHFEAFPSQKVTTLADIVKALLLPWQDRFDPLVAHYHLPY